MKLADLRKKARHLENEVDGKLLTLNKIGVSLGSANARFDTGYQLPSAPTKLLFPSLSLLFACLVEVSKSLSSSLSSFCASFTYI